MLSPSVLSPIYYIQVFCPHYTNSKCFVPTIQNPSDLAPRLIPSVSSPRLIPSVFDPIMGVFRPHNGDVLPPQWECLVPIVGDVLPPRWGCFVPIINSKCFVPTTGAFCPHSSLQIFCPHKGSAVPNGKKKSPQ